MKTLVLKLGDKLYTTSRITARLSREAFELHKDVIDAAYKAKDIKPGDEEKGDISDEDFAAAKNLMDTVAETEIRKLNLICEVYGNKFTADELENNLSKEEIDDQISKIINGIQGIVEKN